MGEPAPSEQWRPVVDHEQNYEVSDLGRVRRRAGAAHGSPLHVLRYRLTRGYANVQLCTGRKKSGRNAKVHALVMAAFVGPRPSRADINHLNGDRVDNRLANLEYCTRSQNLKHAADVLHSTVGEKHHNARLTDAQVLEIRRAPAGMGHRILARQFKVARETVRDIRLNRTWRHVA